MGSTMRFPGRGWSLVALSVFLLTLGSSAASAQTKWVGTWASSQQTPEPANALPPESLNDATQRQVVHLSVGGPMVRVRISNAFGTSPLHITSIHVARPLEGAKIDPPTDRALSFSGSPDVLLPAGAEYISDPLPFPVAAMSDLAITLHLEIAPAQQTGHPGSRATSYLAHGNLTGAADLPAATKIDHWYFVSGVDVAEAGAAVVTLGDSITDGHASTTNGNDRWPDDLSRRLQASPATRGLGVPNDGSGGNRLLLDGLGPNAMARLDRDVLAQTGAQYLIVLEGVNDLGTLTRDGAVSPGEHAVEVHRILAAYEQMITRAHSHGIKVIGGTILPYGGSNYYHPDANNEADRAAVNAWIRAPGHFDAVVDFDKAMQDPAHPNQLLPAYDSGDHLHPSPAGYRVMGEAVPLSLFTDARTRTH
jgi:lysophospholipase L1-like esterase